jgi:hypothetical protein
MTPPEAGVTNPATTLSRVDFPHPECPMMETYSPSPIDIEMPCRTSETTPARRNDTDTSSMERYPDMIDPFQLAAVPREAKRPSKATKRSSI